LLRIFAGVDEPSAGSIEYYSDTNCALLSQTFEIQPGITVMESLELAAGSQVHPPGEAIKRFGFAGQESRLASQLSGGEKTRLALAGIWLSEADLLLLDEPTNHLDIQNMDWLEGFILEYPGTIILVSHDRYFIDRTVKRVLELNPAGVTSYPGNYTDYQQALRTKTAQAAKSWQQQEKRSKKLRQAISEQKNWAENAHRHAVDKARQSGIKSSKVHYRSQAKKSASRVQNNIHRLERMREEEIERPKTERTIDLSFKNKTRSSHTVLRAEGISKSFGRHLLLANGRFTLQHGEKAALIGANGTGKTTLLRMIAGLEAPDQGELWVSPSLKIAYLQQEMQTLNHEQTVLEELLTVNNDPGRVRSLLADLLLCGDAVFKPCGVLSQGERVRVALARILLGVYDLLLLDEPGNYLDLPSREKLEEALQAFTGSIILVSHDRYMLERVASSVWAINRQSIKVYPGSFSDYQAKLLAEKNPARESKSQLDLEIRKSRLISQLSQVDRNRNEAEYLRLEKEFLATMRLLQE